MAAVVRNTSLLEDAAGEETLCDDPEAAESFFGMRTLERKATRIFIIHAKKEERLVPWKSAKTLFCYCR